jgi:hypothetical protein
LEFLKYIFWALLTLSFLQSRRPSTPRTRIQTKPKAKQSSARRDCAESFFEREGSSGQNLI